MEQTTEEVSDSWLDEAACKGMPVDLFFNEYGNVPRRARMTCQSCEVVRQCLEDALLVSIREDFGYRAGTSAKQRRQIRTERQKLGTYKAVSLRFDDVVGRFYRV